MLSPACQSAPSREAAAAPEPYDLILRGGTIYDGSGGKPFTGDVAIARGLIVAVGKLPPTISWPMKPGKSGKRKD